MKRNKLIIAGFAFLLVLTFWGCSKADRLLSITVAPDKVTLLSGGMQPLAVNASFKSGAVKGVANWTCTSSNPAIAAVDTNGYIKALSAGSTNLTVSYNENGISKEVMVPVEVTPAPRRPTVYYVSE